MISLRLPATSANLGPGFDAVALALALYLEVDAVESDAFRIEATGECPETCGALAGNLLLDTYRQTWLLWGSGEPAPLALTVRNGIPLGMGCGSSAASRLAGIALASHFGGLGWGPERMLDEVAEFEGHPDNAAACCWGGYVASGYASALKATTPRRVLATSIAPPAGWHALLVLPEQPLATTASRAVLPKEYGREMIVENLQNVALLTAAFSTGNGAQLADATRDRLHQPFRAAVCPLLPCLLPLAGTGGILSVTLSGAGSGVLLLLASEGEAAESMERVRQAAEPLRIARYLPCGLAREAAVLQNRT